MRSIVLLSALLLGLGDVAATESDGKVLMAGADLRSAAEKAADGAVLSLAPGRFPATLLIEDKTLTLEGDGGGGTVIEAEQGARTAISVGVGARLILRRLELVPAAKLGGDAPEFMLEVQGGVVEAEDVSIEAGAGAMAAVHVEHGSARFERVDIVHFGTGIGVSGASDASIELLASKVDVPFGTAVSLENGNRLAIEGGFGIRGATGVVVEGGAPDIHVYAADIAGTRNDALRIDAGGQLTINGGRLFARSSALTVGGHPSSISIDGVSFHAEEGPAVFIGAIGDPNTIVDIRASRFGLKGMPSLGGDATPAVHVAGTARLTFTDNLVASEHAAGLRLEAGLAAAVSGNLLSGQWGSLLIDGDRMEGATRAEIIVQPMSDELPRGLDPQTLALIDVLAADPALRERMRDAAIEAARGSDTAFDALAVLAEEVRRACNHCDPLKDTE